MIDTVLTLRAARLAAVLAVVGVLAACETEQPPRSVAEFMENPILLEAAVVRCAQNRAESRYDPECVNAREAIKIIEAREEAERRAELEAMSERKREALRRTQRAAAEARRRAEEERRRLEEAEYLAQFGELPPESAPAEVATGSNAPTAVIPEPPTSSSPAPITSPYDAPGSGAGAGARVDEGRAPEPIPDAGGQVPVPAPEPEPVEEAQQPADLEAIREELRRRNEGDGS